MESILKTRFRTAETFLRTAMGRGSKIGMGRGKGGAMGKGKGAGNPEAKPHGEKRLRFVELFWSSLHATVGVSTVGGQLAVSGGCPKRTHFVYLLFSVHLSPNAAFVFRHCLRENVPLCFAAPFFGICLFVLTVGVHPQLKNCILLGGSSHLVSG